MGKNSIRVVLLGLGSVATKTHNGGHLKQYLNDPEIEVVAGVDPNDDARKEALKKGVPVAYPSFEEAIDKERFDFVSILTPTDCRLYSCRLAALANKNILCEKPLAASLEEALEIEEIVKKSGVYFAVSMNLRFLPSVQAIQDQISSRYFGQLFFLDFDECTSFNWTTYGNRNPKNYRISEKPFWGNPKDHKLQRLIILDKVTHFIDLVKIWSDGNIISAYAQGGCQGCHMDAGENISSIHLILDNGLRCRFLNVWGSHFDDRAGGELSTRIRIFGDKRTGIYESRHKNDVGKYSVFEKQKQVLSMQYPPTVRKDFADSLKTLAKSVRTERNNYTNLESAIEVLRVVEACYKSIETNSVINIATYNKEGKE